MTIEARKIELVQRILSITNPILLADIESVIEAQMSIELSEAHKAVLDDRLEDHNASPTSGRTWKELSDEVINNEI